MADRYRDRDRFGGDYGSEGTDYDRGFQSEAGGWGRDEGFNSSGYGNDRDYGSQFDDYGRRPAGGDRGPDFGRDRYSSPRMSGGSESGEYSGRESIRGYDRGRSGAYDSNYRSSNQPRFESEFDRSSSWRNEEDRYGSDRNYSSRERDIRGDRNSLFGRDEEAFDNRGRVGVPGYGTAYGGWSGNYDSTGTRGTSGRMPNEKTGDRGGYGASSSSNSSSRTESYRGRGPKGFQRSDERIREMVCERLEDSEAVDASEIDVSVTGGEVTLSGMVHDRHMKRLAEDVAEAIPGVRDVNNDLRVNRSLLNRMADGLRGAVAGVTHSQERFSSGQTAGTDVVAPTDRDP